MMFRRGSVTAKPEAALSKRRHALLARRGTVNGLPGASQVRRVSGSEQAGRRDVVCRERRVAAKQMDTMKAETSGISIMVQRRPSADSSSSSESVDYNDNKKQSEKLFPRKASLDCVKENEALPDLLADTDTRKRRASEQFLAEAHLSDDIRRLDQMFRMMRALQEKEERAASPSPLSSYEQIILRRKSIGQFRPDKIEHINEDLAETRKRRDIRRASDQFMKENIQRSRLSIFSKLKPITGPYAQMTRKSVAMDTAPKFQNAKPRSQSEPRIAYEGSVSDSLSSSSENISPRSPTPTNPVRREIIEAMKSKLQKGLTSPRNPDLIVSSPIASQSLQTPRKDPLPRIHNGCATKFSAFDEIVEVYSNDVARERESKGQQALDVAVRRSAAVTPPVGSRGELGDDNKRKEKKGKAKNKTKVAPVDD